MLECARSPGIGLGPPRAAPPGYDIGAANPDRQLLRSLAYTGDQTPGVIFSIDIGAVDSNCQALRSPAYTDNQTPGATMAPLRGNDGPTKFRPGYVPTTIVLPRLLYCVAGEGAIERHACALGPSHTRRT